MSSAGPRRRTRPSGPLLSYSGGRSAHSLPFRGRSFAGRGSAGRGNKTWTKANAPSGTGTVAAASAFARPPAVSSPPLVEPVLMANPQEQFRPQASQLLSAWRLAAADAAAAATAASAAAAAAAFATRAASRAAAASHGTSSSAEAMERASPFVTRAGNLQWKAPDAVSTAAAASSQQRGLPSQAATASSRGYQLQPRVRPSLGTVTSWQAAARTQPWWAKSNRRAVVSMRGAPGSSLKWVRGATTTTAASAGPLLHLATGNRLYGNKRMLRPRSISRLDPQLKTAAVAPGLVTGAFPMTTSKVSAAAAASAADGASVWRWGQKVYLRTASGMSLRRMPSAGSVPPARAAAAARQKNFGHRVLLRAKHAYGVSGTAAAAGSGSSISSSSSYGDGNSFEARRIQATGAVHVAHDHGGLSNGGGAFSAGADLAGKRKRGAAAAAAAGGVQAGAGLSSAKAAVARARLLLTRNRTLRLGGDSSGSGSSTSGGKGAGILALQGKGKATTEGTAVARAKGELCLFFNRFGVCNRGDECSYVHDRSKVAVCGKFLRGECREEACPLTHEVQSEKMPVCSFFLRGLCVRENCPYRHVKVAADAAVCSDFLKGYCPRGLECRLKHELPAPGRGKKRGCGSGSNGNRPHGNEEGVGSGRRTTGCTARTGEQSGQQGSGAAAQRTGDGWAPAATEEEGGKRKFQRIAAPMEEEDEDDSVLPSFARRKRPAPA